MIQEQIKRIDLIGTAAYLPEQELIALLNGQSQELCDYLFQKQMLYAGQITEPMCMYAA